MDATGKTLPGISKTGQLLKKEESLSVSNVADITTTLRGKDRPFMPSRGLEKTFFNKPKRMSCNEKKQRLNTTEGGRD